MNQKDNDIWQTYCKATTQPTAKQTQTGAWSSPQQPLSAACPVKSDMSDLIAGIMHQAIWDLQEITKLDAQTYTTRHQAAILSNWWGAYRYINSEDFSLDCEQLWLDVETIRQRLAPLIKAGRAIYGREVKKLNSVSIGG